MSKNVFVGLSGGVDSSLTAYLLKEQGYNVTGVFIKNWDGHDEQCTIRQDLEDARAVASFLSIPFKTVDFISEYRTDVFDMFLDSIERGLTPNPDIFCNKYVKFEAFFNWALSHGADYVATGHYAQINDHGQLLCGSDPVKDQTYFLYAINRDYLDKILFPLGSMHKSEVRDMAESIQLPVSSKKDSTGICFIGPKNFKDFVQNYIPKKKGEIITKNGDVVGTHSGVIFYTLGQRSGLEIGGQKRFDGRPWYVVQKNFKSNSLIVSQDRNDPSLISSTLTCDNFHWLIDPILTSSKAQCRIRHGQKKQECWLYPNTKSNQVQVKFIDPQRAITPGQAVVFYSDNICIGGGTILSDQLL